MHGLWDQPEIPTVPFLTRARAQTHAHAGDQAAQSGAAMHHFLLIHYTHTQRRREEKKMAFLAVLLRCSVTHAGK